MTQPKVEADFVADIRKQLMAALRGQRIVVDDAASALDVARAYFTDPKRPESATSPEVLESAEALLAEGSAIEASLRAAAADVARGVAEAVGRSKLELLALQLIARQLDDGTFEFSVLETQTGVTFEANPEGE